jgi:hypothetical protein
VAAERDKAEMVLRRALDEREAVSAAARRPCLASLGEWDLGDGRRDGSGAAGRNDGGGRAGVTAPDATTARLPRGGKLLRERRCKGRVRALPSPTACPESTGSREVPRCLCAGRGTGG